MPQVGATIVFALGVLGLFILDRDRKSRVSPALWIPVVWLSISASRMVSQWLGGVGALASADALEEGSPLDALIFAGLLAAGLVVLLARGERAGTFLRANGPLLVFFFYCAVSLLWSDYPFVAFKRWTKAVGDLVMVLVVLTDPEPTAALKRFIARSGFLLVPLSILLIGYYPGVGWTYSPWTGEAYNIGVATTKNGLGIVCLVFGLGSLWRFFETLHSEERPRMTGPLIAHGAVLAMVLWLFGIAHSATSFSCFLIGGGIMVVTGQRALPRKPAVVHLLVGVVLFVVLYALLLNPGSGLVETIGRDLTLTGRTALWDHALGMTADPLFGAGYESFWDREEVQKTWRTEWGRPNHAHNGYLEVFLNLGWVGVALVGLVMSW